MIDVEIWQSGAGSLPMWRGKLPELPRKGEVMHIGTRECIVDRVYWMLGDRALLYVHIFVVLR